MSNFIKDGDEVKRIPVDALLELKALQLVIYHQHVVLDVFDDYELTDKCFSEKRYRETYKYLQQLRNDGSKIDIVELKSVMLKAGHDDSEIDGIVMDVTNVPGISVTVASSVAKQLVELYKLRKIAKVVSDTFYQCSNKESSASEIEEILIEKIKMLAIGMKGKTADMTESVLNGLGILEKGIDADSKLLGISTGFYQLDRLLNGFVGGELNVLAARPAQGKTALASNMAIHAALWQNRNVLIYSVEMSINQLILRLLCSESFVNSHHLKVASLMGKSESVEYKEDKNSIYEFALFLKGCDNLIIDESPTLSTTEIVAKTERYNRNFDGKLDLIVIDYLQLIKEKGFKQDANRTYEIAHITRVLKNLSVRLDVPILLLSQLNRGLEKRTNRRPVLSDLKDSGAIEQDADNVIFIHRAEEYTKKEEDYGVAEIILAKHRQGPTGMVKLAWCRELTRFFNILE